MKVSSSAKRRRKIRPRRIFGLWSRVAVLILMVVISAFLFVRGIVKAYRPYRLGLNASADLRDLHRQIDMARQTNLRLSRRVAYLNTPDGIITESRRLGYVRPGENAFLVTLPPPPAPSAPAPPPSASPPAPSFSERAHGFWRRVTGHR